MKTIKTISATAPENPRGLLPPSPLCADGERGEPQAGGTSPLRHPGPECRIPAIPPGPEGGAPNKAPVHPSAVPGHASPGSPERHPRDGGNPVLAVLGGLAGLRRGGAPNAGARRSGSFLALGIAAVLLVAGWTTPAVAQDLDPPSVVVLENGAPLADGSFFARNVVPVIQVADASTFTVAASLDGAAYVSGTAVTAEGLHELVVTATDAANYATTLALSFEINRLPPSFVAISPAAESVTAAAAVTLQGELDGAVGLTVDGVAVPLSGGHFSAGPYALVEGPREWSLVARDAAGNSAARAHRVVRDAVAPTLSILQPAAGAVVGASPAEISGSAADLNLSAVSVNGVAASRTGNAWTARVPLAEGANEAAATATDAAGNSAAARRGLVLDSRAPAVAITSPASGTVVPGTTLTVRGVASDAHLDRVEVNGVAASLAGGAWSATVSLEEGSNTLEAAAFDTLGHRAGASVLVHREGEAPAIAITAPAAGARLAAATVDVAGTVADQPGLAVTVGGAPATVSGGAFSLAAVALAEGENRLIARVADGLGHQGSHSLLVYRDTVAPAIAGSSPADGATGVAAGATFEIRFSEEVAGGAADWRLETAAGAAIAASGSFAGEALLVQPSGPLPSAGQLRLVVGAGIRDLAGNPLGAARTFAFTTRDAQAPAAPVLQPAPPAALCAARLELTGHAESLAAIEATGGAAAAGARADEAGAFALSVPLAPGQRHQLQIVARDAGGNASAPLLLEVTQDCVPPTVLGARLTEGAFEIRFDEKVDPSSLAGGAIALHATAGPLAGGTVLAAGGEVAVFTPEEPLPPAAAVRLDVGTAVRDRAGNALAFPFSQVFGGEAGDSFVAGRVIDSGTGRPLAGARVVVAASDGVPNPVPEPQQTTGEDGRFSIALPAGVHHLVVLRAGYTPVFRGQDALPGLGADVVDPRLTRAAPPRTLGPAGGVFPPSGEALLEIPAGALAAPTALAATLLEEQALPALLPYGWSPRGAAWVDLGGAELAAPATLHLPVALPDGGEVPVARLDPATLQWHVVALVPVSGGAAAVAIPGEGAYAALAADAGPLAPPAALAGAVLGSAAAPNGDQVLSASLAFDPELVLPAQRSEVTARYQVAQPVASGLPLTLRIREELTLLDGSVRHQPTYESDLVLYHDAAGEPASHFGLAPSLEARQVPIEVGAEEVALRRYLGAMVRGNVLGPAGGVVETPEGDRVELAAGSVGVPTPVVLARRTAADLPVALPAGLVFEGLLDLGLAGQTLGLPATLELELGGAPAAGQGLLFGFEERGSARFLRPLASLEATAGGWRTAAIPAVLEAEDLAWPGVRRGGLYLFARSTVDLAFARGTVFGLGGAPLPGAWISSPGLGWIQVSAADGGYVLPLPLGPRTLLAENLPTLDRGAAAVAPATLGQRLDADLHIAATGPRILSVTPADGSTGVILGIEPAVTFSEAVDPDSLTAGIQLYQDGQRVPASLEVQGTQVRLLPDATLRPGRPYELRVSALVRDLEGHRLEAGGLFRFTTVVLPVYDDIDFTRIHLFEPNAQGRARVLGRTGAAPAGALVFVENISRLISTPSATAGSDGGFELLVEARLGDVLLLHVSPVGRNETVVELTPFLTADGQGAYADARASVFTTLDGIEVKIDAGTFDRPTVVRLKAVPITAVRARRPNDFDLLYAFDLDTGGVGARKALQLRLPVAAAGEFPILLGRELEVLGEWYWTFDALLRPEDGMLTTADDPDEIAGLGIAFPGLSPRPLAQLAAAGSSAALLEALAGTALGPVAAPQAAQVHRKSEYLLGAGNEGRYLIQQATTQLQFALVPLMFIPGAGGFLLNLGLQGMLATLHLTTLAVAYDAILVPTRRGEPIVLNGHDVAGLRLWERTYGPPPPGEILILPPDDFGDEQPPAPISGSPLRFDLIVPVQSGVREIDGRIDQTAVIDEDGAGTLTVAGQAGAVGKNVKVQLTALDPGDNAVAAVQSSADGSFTLSIAVRRGHRYLLSAGARIGAQQTLDLAFSEELAAGWAGIEVFEGDRKLAANFIRLETREKVRIEPPTVWQAGRVYRLKLGTVLADGAGNTWNRSLEVPFEVEGSQVGQTFPLAEVRDVARVGSLVFVAAGEDGLAVLDGSDPLHLKSLVTTGDNQPLYFPFPLADPVSAVAVDPHGRVFVAGGGLTGYGQLKIFDPTALDPAAIAADPNNLEVRYAAFRGSTLISDRVGTGGTTLPEGRPRRLAIHSDDETVRFRIGDLLPSGISVSYSEPLNYGNDVVATFSGLGGSSGKPVTVKNLSRGRWRRQDAGLFGGYDLELEVRRGDRIEVVFNRHAVAYVAVSGVGVQIVDIDSFYNETHDSPGSWIASDIIGTYTGVGDSDLVLCNQPVSDISSAMLDIGLLRDEKEDPPHPLSVVALIGFRGLALFDSPLGDPAELSFFNEACLNQQSPHVSAIEIAENYPFDLNHNGKFEPGEYRDYILVAHRVRGIFLIDAENREELAVIEEMRLPGALSELTLDRERRLLFVAGSEAGLHVLDFDRAPLAEPDADHDGKSDRLIETLALEGNTNSPTLVVPELGIAFAGGLGRGLTGISFAGPHLAAVGERMVQDGEEAGEVPRWSPLTRVSPYGVPVPAAYLTAAETFPASFRLLASLPGFVGDEVRLEVVSLGPSGTPIQPAGDAQQLPNLPRVALEGDGDQGGVVLRRLAENRWEDGYQMFLSRRVEAIADLRAAKDFERTADEETACVHCVEERDETEGLRQVLSGHQIAIRLSESLRTRLGALYASPRLDRSEVRLASVPWDISPAIDQEPLSSPSRGGGAAVPGTLLHSGELTQEATDLVLRGAMVDMAFTRTYRSQTLGSGPLGPGWDFGYHQRLREAPNGNVDFFDGQGRRETFVKVSSSASTPVRYTSPPGRFVQLSRTAAGWVMIDARHNLTRFDRFGRLTAMADWIKSEAGSESGTELTFEYDARSRLVRIEAHGREILLDYDDDGRLVQVSDFSGRVVDYEYDDAGRLVRVKSPQVTTGLAGGPKRLETVYEYSAASGGELKQALHRRDNLVGITNAKNQKTLTFTYADANQDGLADEVTAETWGGHPLTIAYDFGQKSAAVTDRRGKVWSFVHDDAGRASRITGPTGAVLERTFNDAGVLKTEKLPGGRLVTNDTPPDTAEPRQLGNITQTRVTPDQRGANGSGTELVTTFSEFSGRTNLAGAVRNPRLQVTRNLLNEVGLPIHVTQPEGVVTQIEYNKVGQPTRITNPNNNVVAYTYYTELPRRGFLETVTVDPEGLDQVTRYEVDDHGNVTAEIDSRGVRHEYVYNELGWLVEDRAPLGLKSKIVYDENGQKVEERVSSGENGETETAVRYEYGSLGETKKIRREVAPGSEVVESFAYDKNLNVIEAVVADGQIIRIEYDDRNLPVKRTTGSETALARFETFAYDAEGQITEYKDTLERSWKTVYDGYGRIKEKIDPLGGKVTTSYDNNNNPLAIRAFDPASTLIAITREEWDGLDRLAGVKEYVWERAPDAPPAAGEEPPEGSRVLARTLGYYPASNLKELRDPRGVVATFRYDAADRLKKEEMADGSERTFTYDAAGNNWKTELVERGPDGGASTSRQLAIFDHLNRVTERTDAAGNVTRYGYDVRGNLVRFTDAESKVTTHTYDGLGRLTGTRAPAGIDTTRTYDPGSRLATLTDALGQVTRWSYDSLGRLQKIRYADDTELRILEYDKADRPLKTRDAMGTEVVASYDAFGRVTQRTITRGEDVEGPESETYQYDALGNVKSASSGSVLTTRRFDSLSRMVLEGTDGLATSYRHDDSGNLVRLQYPSGRQVSYTPDTANRLSAVDWQLGNNEKIQKTVYSYRGPQVAEKLLGVALQGKTEFDAGRRPVSSSFANAANERFFAERVKWNARNLRQAITRGDQNNRGYEATYDAAGRLSMAEAKVRTEAQEYEKASIPHLPDVFAYTFDGAQNLLSMRQDEACESDVDALPLDGSGRNRPGSVDGETLAWDANGNLRKKGDRTFTYDYRNRLTRVLGPGNAEVAAYSYDAFDRRVSKRVAGVDEETVWAGWQPIEIYRDGVLKTRRTYGLGLDEVISVEQDLDGTGGLEREYLPIYDATNNVAMVTDTAGKPIEKYAYSPFGDRWIEVDGTPPAWQQLRVVGSEIWLEASEEGDLETLIAAAQNGSLQLHNGTRNGNAKLKVSQPVQEGRQARHRVVLSDAEAGSAASFWPVGSENASLTVPAAALRDLFGNRAVSGLSRSFTWPAAPAAAPLEDNAAPRVVQVCTTADRRIELELSEPPDENLLETVIALDGSPIEWELDPDGYTLRSNPLEAGSYQLVLSTDPLDLAGSGLGTAFNLTVEVSASQPAKTHFSAPLPGLVASSTVASPLGWHGFTLDEESGFYHVRHRYYDPELGRFTTTDPLGFEDGPNPYQFALNSPLSLDDPTGQYAFPFLAKAAAAGLTVYLVGDAAIDRMNQDSDRTLGQSLFLTVAQAMAMGIADNVGITGLFEGASGVEVITGRELAGWERIGRGSQGLLDAVTSFKSGGKKPAARSESAALGSVPSRRLTTEASELVSAPGTCLIRCFVPGTMVSTATGERPIENLAIGDKVWALNLETRQNELAEVVRLFQREAPETWLLTIDGGQQLETTDEHPFFVEGKGFTRADQLQPGDRLRTFDGESIRLESIGIRSAPRTVYNFEVADQHNYYVGTQQVLVHNCGAGFRQTEHVAVEGKRAIDRSQVYENEVRQLYGGSTHSDRRYSAIVDGKKSNGVADAVATVAGREVAVEAKYVDNWADSIRNPAQTQPWAKIEQQRMLEQARKYSAGYQGGVIYHTNSPELAAHYSQVFRDAGITNFEFFITPAIR